METQMPADEIAYRQQLIAKNTVAAKRERDAQDKAKRDRPVLKHYRKSH
jgi:hypothetical protein